jgi:hypothetical protein
VLFPFLVGGKALLDLRCENLSEETIEQTEKLATSQKQRMALLGVKWSIFFINCNCIDIYDLARPTGGLIVSKTALIALSNLQ